MSEQDPTTIDVETATAHHRQVRGGVLLLAGRVLGVLINLAVQVLIVRHLTRPAFGAFAYALSVATIGEGLALVGLDRAVARFLPIDLEHGRVGRALGTLLFAAGVAAGVGTAVVLVVLGFRGAVAGEFADDPTALTVLVILAVLAPVQALDRLVVQLFAVFDRPGAIVLRRYILTPGLRLAVVAAVVGIGAGSVALAVGYVAAGLVGLVVYGAVLARMLARRGLFRARPHIEPWPLLAFSLPVLSTELLMAAINQSDAVMLAHLGTPSDVAAMRAVYPVARLNQIVLQAFAVLFVPAAARAFARGDGAGVDRLYWSTATWVAVLSFPAVLVTVGFAAPVTELLFGARYADAAVLLALLSVGYFAQGATGPNGMTLQVYGHVRYLLAINAVAGAANVVGNLLLIPRYGATGAAIATTGTLILHNAAKQWGLRRCAGVHAIHPHYLPVYLTIAAGLLVAGLGAWAGWSLPVAVLVAAAAVGTVLAASRGRLEVRAVLGRNR